MRTSIVLSLDQRRPRKDGTCPVVFRLSHNRKTTAIASGYAISPEFWDETGRKVKSRYRGTVSPERLNNHLTKRRATMIDEITRMADQGRLAHMSLPQLKQRLVANGKQNSFFAYADTVVSELIEAGRVGTATSYRAIVNILRQFRADRDLSFEELNLDLLQRFERWHLSRGNGYGGLAVYMKSVRAIYNKAIKAGLAEKAGYPFDDYVIRSGKPRKRAIPADAISRIRTLSLKDGTTLSRDRDIFLLCFYLRGMPYVDLAHLRLSNIIDGRIQYNRQKTNEPFTVKIPDQAWPILDKFIQGKQPGEYLLPVIKDRKLAMAQYKAVANARIRYNRNLKKLAALAGIDETLTSYVARHSYASIANDMEVPIAAISEMLGHQKISTTQAYLNALHKSRLDDYQDKVLSAL